MCNLKLLSLLQTRDPYYKIRVSLGESKVSFFSSILWFYFHKLFIFNWIIIFLSLLRNQLFLNTPLSFSGCHYPLRREAISFDSASPPVAVGHFLQPVSIFFWKCCLSLFKDTFLSSGTHWPMNLSQNPWLHIYPLIYPTCWWMPA